jgi:hypothetical protein
VWPIPVLSTQPTSSLTYEIQYGRLSTACQVAHMCRYALPVSDVVDEGSAIR